MGVSSRQRSRSASTRAAPRTTSDVYPHLERVACRGLGEQCGPERATVVVHLYRRLDGHEEAELPRYLQQIVDHLLVVGGQRRRNYLAAFSPESADQAGRLSFAQAVSS